jgi:aminodeoxyfutalosine deaminase
MTQIYAARWVLPIISQVIEDGAIAIDGSHILAVGPRHDVVPRFPEAKIEDFHQAAILPGFINAHSHLELTVMRGFLEHEESDFFTWLRKLTIARMAMTSEDLLVSATCGAMEAARAGVTCLGDASSSAAHAMNALRQIGLRGIVYQESFGPDPNLASENVAKLSEQIAALRPLETDLVSVGVSPHATYTVSGPQLRLISQLAIDEKLPLMMHAAESKAEQQFMHDGSGPFADGLRARGIEWQAAGVSTIQYLERHDVLATHPLLAHCINVDETDLELLDQNRAGIAHCPKSNAKLGHGRAPFSTFMARELRVGLGSDSVASNNTCDILAEARYATLISRLPSSIRNAQTSAINAEESIFAATLGGARAIGLDGRIGALAKGMQADLVVISLDGAHQMPAQDPEATLVFSSSARDVLMTMVAGKETYREGAVPGIDAREQLNRLEAIRIRLDSLG